MDEQPAPPPRSKGINSHQSVPALPVRPLCGDSPNVMADRLPNARLRAQSLPSQGTYSSDAEDDWRSWVDSLFSDLDEVQLRPVPSCYFSGRSGRGHQDDRVAENILPVGHSYRGSDLGGESPNEFDEQSSSCGSGAAKSVQELQAAALGARPRPCLANFSRLDSYLKYRAEKARWRQAESQLRITTSANECIELLDNPRPSLESRVTDGPINNNEDEHQSSSSPIHLERCLPFELDPKLRSAFTPHEPFTHIILEVVFCVTICITQFLCEYLLSGFAIELPRLLKSLDAGIAGSMGTFWPASLLTLGVSSMLLISARTADLCGGYCPFMFGALWLTIWTAIPSAVSNPIVLDVSRGMQGLAIAAFVPATFALLGRVYTPGTRRNVVMGLYSGCAPVGFFAGFMVAGSVAHPRWYFLVAAVLSFTAFVLAYVSIPKDSLDKRDFGLKSDCIGCVFIFCGLVGVSFSLAAQPYGSDESLSAKGWIRPTVSAPFCIGIVSLALAFWYEGWRAPSPLIPFDFFKPKSVKGLSLACLFFYASYGVWLYESVEFFRNSAATGGHVEGNRLALWYLPTAMGGVVLCGVGGVIVRKVPMFLILLVSAAAWIVAPLLLALAPLPLNYWEYVLPSMLCATIGIDLTFTISVIYLSSVQPLRYQGLAGAVSSILVNVSISFALSVSELVSRAAGKSDSSDTHTPGVMGGTIGGYRASFIYGAASATVGMIICVCFARVSWSAVEKKNAEEATEAEASV